jgi:putative solute:sodium symporter small subunit
MSDSHDSKTKAYWRKNIHLVLILLTIWFIVSYGMGILFADAMDNFKLFGFHFGFWMTQQGSIFCFVILTFVYVYKMNKLDHKYNVDEDEDDYVPAEIEPSISSGGGNRFSFDDQITRTNHLSD